jgi:hypothetical protein
MSGPITAGYVLASATLALAQAALKEARAMKREYGDVLDQLRAREEEQVRNRAAQQAARLERVAAVRREAERQSARLERLRILAAAVPDAAEDLTRTAATASPAPPSTDDDAAWSMYLRELETALTGLQTLLAKAGGAANDRVREALAATSAAPTLDDVLAGYVLQRQMKPGLDASQADRFRDTAARVLGRLELAPGAAIPSELEALARAIVLAPTVERAEALASELRLAVQRQRDALNRQRRDSEDARRILAELAPEAPEALRRALEHVAAGVEPLDGALRKSAQEVLDNAAADRLEREQQAAAYVLEQSLRDLGYEVEAIEATLFADGGVVHFRRAGWENYYVRLRIDAQEHTANFNVVRARGDEDNAERRRLDALAEDRWCAEFPRLMQTLAARGLSLDVTRRLGAGEIPVQVVNGETLPRVYADEDASRPRASPLARRTP